ncbi:hypothetical protein [Polaromonas sp. JS666]|uniref:hypothetical protein n=1 Tax=Polaromonas sp. (strain JS666 / ATCC BAA-500) TaxID=296591 RepID=UPI0008854D0C|nr:hypothetical protein [Polaromonas sp. JS666]SDN51944.1 hypothetical protein SAMN05720382_105318 [Polaromonas sp. JS666]
MTPILGFAPDAEKTMPGILTACSHVIPYEAGFRGAPSPVAVTADALAAECRGAVVAVKLDGTRRILAGTQTKLYELTGSTWGDVSTGSYTGSSETRWSFCQFGDTTIATNLVDAMQSSSATTFAPIAGAPKAKIVVSASNNFVLAFNTSDPTYGVNQDGWWNCAQNDQTNWAPNVSTLANRGRLVAVEGPIQAALTLGDYVVAYKHRAIFVGIFVGTPVVWQWNLIPGGEAGVVGQEAVCDIGGAHFIVGNDNFWLFDGTRPAPIGDGVTRQWFLNNSSPTYRYRTKVSYDKQNDLVRVNYPSLTSTGQCDATLVYHVKKKQWGNDDVTTEASLNFIAPGVTIDGLDAFSSTIDGLPDVPFDSQYWLSGGQTPAYFNSSHRLVSLNGTTASSSFTTGDMGDDDAVTLIERFRVRFEQSPTTASATGFVKFNEGDALMAGATNAINDGKFDLRQSGRFHRVRVDMTGDHKEYAFDAKPRALGGR